MYKWVLTLARQRQELWYHLADITLQRGGVTRGAVPQPASLLLVASGLMGVAALLRHRLSA
jgi:hypothetical protein